MNEQMYVWMLQFNGHLQDVQRQVVTSSFYIFSAGVGRTGTIIALDISLDQLKTEDEVNVQAVVNFLRQQRTQMVQVLVRNEETSDK